MSTHSGDGEGMMQGWYRADTAAAPLRVRVTIKGDVLCLHSLTGQLLVRWSLARLENRGIPFWGRDWPIGDCDLPEPTLTVENDEDYATIRNAAPRLRPLRARMWRQFLLWPDAHGNFKAGPALIWAMLAAALILTGWRFLSF
jgi:hypothetical protein